jgi:hypothetical protein
MCRQMLKIVEFIFCQVCDLGAGARRRCCADDVLTLTLTG